MNDRYSISIAVLSQDEDDVALINGTLRDGGHAAHCHWIDRPNKLDETLSAEQVELIIVNCDRYPEGIRQVIKQKDRFNPEVPVIALRKVADENAIQDFMLVHFKVEEGDPSLLLLGHVAGNVERERCLPETGASGDHRQAARLQLVD